MKRVSLLLTAPKELLSLRIHHLLMLQMGKTKYASYCMLKKSQMLTQLNTQRQNIIRKIRLCGEKMLPAKAALVYRGTNQSKEVKAYRVTVVG